MVGWHHQLNGHEFEQTLGDSEGQGSLASCSPWGHKESDTTEGLHNKESRMVVAVGWGSGIYGDAGQRVYIFSDKMNIRTSRVVQWLRIHSCRGHRFDP